MGKIKQIFSKIIKNVKGNSLRMRFLGFTLICWIIPLSVLGAGGIMLYQNYRDELETLMLSETNYAGEFCMERLSAAYDESGDSTYDRVVEDCYLNYRRGEISHRDLIHTVKGYTNIKYIGESFCMADVIFVDDYNFHFYLSDNSMAFWDEYQQKTYATLLDFSKDLTARTGVCIINNKIFLIRRLLTSDTYEDLGYNQSQDYGLFILQVDEDYLFEHYMTNAFWDGKMAFAVNDYSGTIGACSKEGLSKAQNGAALMTDWSGNQAITGAYGTPISPITFKYSLYPSMKSLKEKRDYYSTIMITFLLLSVPLLAGGTFLFFYKINKPIQELIKATQSIESGHLGVAIEYEHEDEFKYLIDNFNNMSREIKYLFDYTYKEEMALKDARLLALQSQINPHFLNNTLEMMNWKARLSGEEELSHMIEALSTVLDAGMNRSKQQLVPLSEELKCVDAYIFIIHKRLGDRIHIQKSIDVKPENLEVPPLIIQPLVENAVVHGIEPADSGTITLRVYEQDGYMCVEVENDGALLSDEDLERIKRALEGEEQEGRKSLGIRNVNERLKLLYGGRCRLEIYRTQNGTTMSKISIGKAENAKIYN